MFNNEIINTPKGQSTYHSNILPVAGGFLNQPRLFIKMIEAKKSYEMEKIETIQIK